MPLPDERLQRAAFSAPFAAYLLSCEGRTLHATDHYQWILAWGEQPSQRLDDLNSPGGWWFGALPYGLGGHFEPTTGLKETTADVQGFWPQGVRAETRGGELQHWGAAPPTGIPLAGVNNGPLGPFGSNFTAEGYTAAVAAIREHIRRGEVYELNLSQRFAADGVAWGDPLGVFQALVAASPVPMAALLKLGTRWVLSASPERFLRGVGGRLVTQPIKGTARRAADPATDAQVAQALAQGVKERAENVMIVDLARNDLNRVCVPGTVVAERLFEVQTYARLHHLVSTVAGTLAPGYGLPDVLRATFPPGSMTGAPKVSALQLIEQYEATPRGLYSGAVGYVNPAGDFDFNVLIRSLIYDSASGQASYHVGGAITYDSDPAAEYAETLLKAEALQAALARL